MRSPLLWQDSDFDSALLVLTMMFENFKVHLDHSSEQLGAKCKRTSLIASFSCTSTAYPQCSSVLLSALVMCKAST